MGRARKKQNTGERLGADRKGGRETGGEFAAPLFATRSLDNNNNSSSSSAKEEKKTRRKKRDPLARSPSRTRARPKFSETQFPAHSNRRRGVARARKRIEFWPRGGTPIKFDWTRRQRRRVQVAHEQRRLNAASQADERLHIWIAPSRGALISDYFICIRRAANHLAGSLLTPAGGERARTACRRGLSQRDGPER